MRLSLQWEVLPLIDSAVIGAGPAGVAASIYLKRAGFEPVIFERGRIGGLLINANLVENYPGFPEGVRGMDLAKLLEKQVLRNAVQIVRDDVKKISPSKGAFEIHARKKRWYSRTVIVATGTTPKRAAIEGHDGLSGRRLFYEVVDLPKDANDKKVVVLGGGDAAFDYSLNLANRGCVVDIVFRKEEPECIPLLLRRARREPGVQIHPGIVVRGIGEENGSVVVDVEKNEEELSLDCDYVLVAYGREPNTGILPKDFSPHEIDNWGEAPIPGLFLAGDVRRGTFRQAGIAVGDGILAAMKVERLLRGEDCEDIR